jgi:hypothetical protein
MLRNFPLEHMWKPSDRIASILAEIQGKHLLHTYLRRYHYTRLMYTVFKMEEVPLKHWYLSTNLHGVTLQNTVTILIS